MCQERKESFFFFFLIICGKQLDDDPCELWIISPVQESRMPMSNPGEPSRFIRPRARGEREVDVDKAKQIKLIKGARVPANHEASLAAVRGEPQI